MTILLTLIKEDVMTLIPTARELISEIRKLLERE